MSKATKKSTKKAATAPRGNTYSLTATGKKALADKKGQGAIIRDCIAKAGAITARGIAEKVGKALGSDTPEKNIAFYLCIWKADGFLKTGKAI